MAVVGGLAWGALLTVLPGPPSPSPALRFALLTGGALLALFGSDLVHLKGAGALAILVMAFTAGVGWRRQGWTDSNPVTEVVMPFRSFRTNTILNYFLLCTVWLEGFHLNKQNQVFNCSGNFRSGCHDRWPCSRWQGCGRCSSLSCSP